MFRKLIPQHQVQDIAWDDVEQSIVHAYQANMKRYIRDRSLISPDRLVEIRFEDLEPVQPGRLGRGQWALAYALSGAVLMDLSMLNRIDTDTRALVLIDATPTHDAMLDSALAEIADSTEERSTRYWLDHFAERAEELKDASLEALVDRGILERREDGFLVPAGGASQMHGEAPAAGYGRCRALQVSSCAAGRLRSRCARQPG